MTPARSDADVRAPLGPSGHVRRADPGACGLASACPSKNVRLLWRPSAARLHDRGGARVRACSTRVIVSTDSEEIAEVARRYGAEVPVLRPPSSRAMRRPTSTGSATCSGTLAEQAERWDCFSILRPTSPFRRADDDPPRMASSSCADGRADSLRAVQPCREHPAKMWILERGADAPGHAQPGLRRRPRGTARRIRRCRSIYVQNASLEIARLRRAAAARHDRRRRDHAVPDRGPRGLRHQQRRTIGSSPSTTPASIPSACPR